MAEGAGKKPARDRVQRLLARLAEAYPEARCALEHRNAYELLLATMLSAQCTDACVNRVTPALFARAPGPRELAGLPLAELEGLIAQCGLFRTKARNILATAQALVERHGGEVPQSLEELTALPGVGRKTAGVVLANAFHGPYLPVDTHVFRVAHRLGLTDGKTPDQVERDLEDLVPPAARLAAHHQLIAHGRQVCAARRPRCGACPLAADCPSRSIFSGPEA
ncbi:MAG: endonuclease III [Chitinophagales bacterium]